MKNRQFYEDSTKSENEVPVKNFSGDLILVPVEILLKIFVDRSRPHR